MVKRECRVAHRLRDESEFVPNRMAAAPTREDCPHEGSQVGSVAKDANATIGLITAINERYLAVAFRRKRIRSRESIG